MRVVAALLWLLALPALAAPPAIRVGSKQFTEGIILGEIATQLLARSGVQAVHRRQLGGTRVLWEALLAAEIDAYVEYTGTLTQEILAGEAAAGDEALTSALRGHGILIGPRLGFNNTYAIGMREKHAGELGIRTISDLASHPELRLAFSNEFMDREDGFPGLRARYSLPHVDVRGLQHDLAYQALQSGSIDVTDLYSTDAEIQLFELRVLQDDIGYFPGYHAVVIHRDDLAPEAAAALRALEGAISEADMVAMNARAKRDRAPEAGIAAEFLERRLGIAGRAIIESAPARLWRHTREHLLLVSTSLLASMVVAIPLGILAVKSPGVGQVILATVGLIQTIPSLALLVFMIPLLGIGGWPAVTAMFLYGLLPIVRNTHQGLRDIPEGLRESAEALGLPARARLRLVELPLASRAILAGIKTSAVINVGTATIGALIGAGGYGQLIVTGITLRDNALILQGAVPAALLALIVQGAFELAERLIVPRGLRR